MKHESIGGQSEEWPRAVAACKGGPEGGRAWAGGGRAEPDGGRHAGQARVGGGGGGHGGGTAGYGCGRRRRFAARRGARRRWHVAAAWACSVTGLARVSWSGARGSSENSDIFGGPSSFSDPMGKNR
jgi:hypothetical protein